ncbi:MAG: SDR family NAD(P)-dependent oxidoreductase [Propionibacteriaceae bacterium]|nr:SDR family NAD(P)-dependent oxidoreductase [Propionibacteriaceae bacterium]
MDKATVIITGGNSGLGYACAKDIASSSTDYTVVLACRNQQRAESAVNRLRQETGNANVYWLILDLASLTSIRSFCAAYQGENYPPLYSIVCNAGFNLGKKLEYTQEGYEATFGVCHLGHYLLVNLLLGQMVDHGRVLYVSSDVHRTKFSHRQTTFTDAYAVAHPAPGGPEMQHYAVAKTCVILGAYEMARRLDAQTSTHITVNAFNPGMMTDTNIWPYPRNKILRRIVQAGLDVTALALRQRSTSVRSAKTLAGLVTQPRYQGVTGKYVYYLGPSYPSSDATYDLDAAKKLWRQSADMVHLKASESLLSLT